VSGRNDLLSQVREALEKEIAELEHRLQLYQLLLSILDSCRETGRSELEEAQEFKTKTGVVYARLLRGRKEVVLVFTEPAPRSNPYTKYMLKALERLKEDYGVEVDVEGGEEGVRRVRVIADDQDVLDEASTILEFAATKLKPKT